MKGVMPDIDREMKTVKKIITDTDYDTVMSKIDALMAKGSENVSKSELAEIRQLALAAQTYEKGKFVVDAPSTLAGAIEMKMYEMKLKQRDLANKLNVSETKLSLILNGKQKPDVNFLKAVYEELHVNADFLLKVV